MSEGQYPVNGYTPADNWLWDTVMPRARPNTFKIVAAVMRQTVGWHREEVRLTLDTFREMTGIAGQGTLVGAVEDALAQGFVLRRRSGRSYVYRLGVRPEAGEGAMPPADGRETGGPAAVERYEDRTGDGTETVQVGNKRVRESYSERYENRTGDGTETVQVGKGGVRKPYRNGYGNRTVNSTEIVHSSIREKKGKRKGKESLPPQSGGQREPAPTPASPEKEGGRPGGEGLAPIDTPYGVYQRLARLEPGIRKGQTLAEAKRLLAGDGEANLAAYTGAEIVACGRFLQSEPWRQARMIPLSTRHIMERIDKWVAAGRPATWGAWEAQRPGRGEEAEPKGFDALRGFISDLGSSDGGGYDAGW